MWIVAILGVPLSVLALYDILDYTYCIIAVGCAKVLCLVSICVSYLAIRTRLKCRVPAIDGAHYKQNEQQTERETLQDSICYDNCISSLLGSKFSGLLH